MRHSYIRITLPLFLCFITGISTVKAQNTANVLTSDIDHFWMAYDSIQHISEKEKQIAVMQLLYIDKGTHGLKAFMDLRKFDAAKLVERINKYPKFWQSIRGNTLKIKPQITAMETYVRKFQTLYPGYRPAKIYFTIGAIRAAGTTKDSMVLIGAEIATGNKNTDISEFPDKRLENFFKVQKEDYIIPIVIHEYVHTQQQTEGKILLGQAICEGACDFITELVLNKPLTNSYIQYGKNNEQQLKQQFRQEMMGADFSNWLYNGAESKTMGDLGYFMGYTICKSYYRHASNKSKAIRDIITLNYADQPAVMQFLKASRYYSGAALSGL